MTDKLYVTTRRANRTQANAGVDDSALAELREAVEQLVGEVKNLKGDTVDADDDGASGNAADPELVANTGALGKLDERRDDGTRDVKRHSTAIKNCNESGDADTEEYVAKAGAWNQMDDG